MAPADLERNKANVIAFYDLMFNESQPAEAIERYAGASTEEGIRCSACAPGNELHLAGADAITDSNHALAEHGRQSPATG